VLVDKRSGLNLTLASSQFALFCDALKVVLVVNMLKINYTIIRSCIHKKITK